MADDYPKKLDVLRRKSRSLLSQLEENSRLVEDEIRKLNIESVNSPRNCTSEPSRGLSSSWRIRNDSSGVNNLLHPLSSVDMTGGRILISSKRLGDAAGPRRPVPGCYCTQRPKKVRYRSGNTVYKPLEPCYYCKSQFELLKDRIDAPVSPALSCETLQKVQSISYTPRSEFLRKVQQKVSQQFNICPEQSADSHHSSKEINSGMSKTGETRESGGGSNGVNRREIEEIQRNRVINIEGDSTIVDPHPGEIIQVPVEVHREDTSSIISRGGECKNLIIEGSDKSRHEGSPKFIRPNDLQEHLEIRQRDFSPEIETILPPKVSHRLSKVVPKKTISSTKCEERKREKKREKSEKVVRTLSQKSCYDECCGVNERRKGSKKSRECADCCSHGDRCLSHLSSGVIPLDEDRETLELRKFREKNYFDTHESSHAIVTCGSSGSLEQYELNSRLFPEPVGRLLKDNIVVSMPPCTTTQLKRIHYFPRNIVREDKRSISNFCKKRHKSCPLTGHAIDLGVLKIPRPADSLALKYQKGVV